MKNTAVYYAVCPKCGYRTQVDKSFAMDRSVKKTCHCGATVRVVKVSR